MTTRDTSQIDFVLFQLHRIKGRIYRFVKQRIVSCLQIPEQNRLPLLRELNGVDEKLEGNKENTHIFTTL